MGLGLDRETAEESGEESLQAGCLEEMLSGSNERCLSSCPLLPLYLITPVFGLENSEERIPKPTV